MNRTTNSTFFSNGGMPKIPNQHLVPKSEARIAALGAPPDDSQDAGEANS